MACHEELEKWWLGHQNKDGDKESGSPDASDKTEDFPQLYRRANWLWYREDTKPFLIADKVMLGIASPGRGGNVTPVDRGSASTSMMYV